MGAENKWLLNSLLPLTVPPFVIDIRKILIFLHFLQSISNRKNFIILFAND